jgi:hypothetical protein
MRKIIVATIVASVLLVTVSFFATQAVAEEMKFRATCYFTKVEAMPVGDVEGHVISVSEQRGVAIFENGECAALLMRGTSDRTKRRSTFQSYSQLTYKDGSTTISKAEGNMEISPGEKLPSLKGKGEWIKGTGKFQGIRGRFTFSGKRITPYSKETKGDLYFEVTGTYTLPSK